MEKNNYKIKDNTFDLPENINKSNPLIDINILVLSIWKINICDKVIYIANVAHKAKFILLADVFIYQLSNFSILQVYNLDIIQSIICKFELESTYNLFYKNKKIYSYIA